MSHYQDHGYVIIDGATTWRRHDSITLLFDQSDYDRTVQVRQNHYRHVFGAMGSGMPGETEQYEASYRRLGQVERHDETAELLDGIRPTLADHAGRAIDGGLNAKAYRMLPGDVMRAHVDDYMASVGFVFFATRKWTWDWGGLLHLMIKGEAVSILPQPNRLVIIDHSRRIPHWVSPIAPYAQAARDVIAGFHA